MIFPDEAFNFIKSLTNCTQECSSIGCKILIDSKRNIAFHFVELSKAENINALTMLDITENYSQRGIKVIQVWEDLWITKNEIVKSRLSAMCGQFARIHARETKVISLSQSEQSMFLEQNHLQGSTVAKYRYGLESEGSLVAVASFAAFRVFSKPSGAIRSTELVRFASLNGYRIAGGLSKLLKHFEREHNPDDIMSYADRDWSDGEGYHLLGFDREAITDPQMFLVNPVDMQRYYSYRIPQKYAYSANPIQAMISDGFISIYNCGNIKYKKHLRV